MASTKKIYKILTIIISAMVIIIVCSICVTLFNINIYRHDIPILQPYMQKETIASSITITDKNNIPILPNTSWYTFIPVFLGKNQSPPPAANDKVQTLFMQSRGISQLYIDTIVAMHNNLFNTPSHNSTSQDDILQKYINTIHLTAGTVGAKAASKALFSNDLTQIDKNNVKDVAIVAYIAGLVPFSGEYMRGLTNQENYTAIKTVDMMESHKIISNDMAQKTKAYINSPKFTFHYDILSNVDIKNRPLILQIIQKLTQPPILDDRQIIVHIPIDGHSIKPSTMLRGCVKMSYSHNGGINTNTYSCSVI